MRLVQLLSFPLLLLSCVRFWHKSQNSVFVLIYPSPPYFIPSPLSPIPYPIPYPSKHLNPDDDTMATELAAMHSKHDSATGRFQQAGQFQMHEGLFAPEPYSALPGASSGSPGQPIRLRGWNAPLI